MTNEESKNTVMDVEQVEGKEGDCMFMWWEVKRTEVKLAEVLSNTDCSRHTFN